MPGPHLPRPEHERQGLALCLSGGGFRAALFHLGALRRLNELDILPHVTTITGVSGGSMMAAFLAARLRPWPRPGERVADWEAYISKPFRAFTSRNLSTGPIARGWLRNWLPWNRKRNIAIDEMTARCETRLTGMNLRDLPVPGDGPRFIFCTVDLVKGEAYLIDRDHEPAWSVGRAVAASSCFPVYFRPFCVTSPRRLALADGGLADNRGVEPVWRTHRTILVSDGGDILRPASKRSVFWLFRTAYVVWNQGQEVRRHWLLENFEANILRGAYWGIDSSPFNYPKASKDAVVAGYSKALACDSIARIRTTYDAFSPNEAAILENHGYFLAEAAARAHLPIGAVPEVHPPHAGWMCERKVKEALKASARALPPRY